MGRMELNMDVAVVTAHVNQSHKAWN